MNSNQLELLIKLIDAKIDKAISDHENWSEYENEIGTYEERKQIERLLKECKQNLITDHDSALTSQKSKPES